MPAATVINALTLDPVWTGVFVKLTYSEDSWPGSTTGGFVEVYAQGRWQRALDLKHRANNLGDVEEELYGGAYGLEENTTYNFRVVFERHDSLGLEVESIEVTGSATTKNSNVPTGSSTTYYWDTSRPNDLGNGESMALAKKTLGSLDTLMGPGRSILLAPIINPDNSVIANLRYRDNSDSPDTGNPATGTRGGSAVAWVRFAPANSPANPDEYGTQVRGYMALDGGWTLESGTTDVWKKSGFSSIQRVEKVFDVTAGKMLPVFYPGLSAADGAAFNIKDETFPGVHYRHSTATLYVRKFTNPTVAPATGELIGAKQLLLQFADVNYLLVEGIDFYMAGQARTTTPPTNDSVGVRFSSCNYVILRNCNLNHCKVSFEGCGYVLIDRCRGVQTGVWETLMDEAVNDPYDPDNGWTFDKNGYRDAQAMYIDSCKNVEIRPSTLSQSQINLGDSASFNAYNDSLENIYVHSIRAEGLSDEFLECDDDLMHAASAGPINLVIAHNAITNTHNFTSFTSSKGGVIWTISNVIREPLFTAYKAGGAAYTESNARIEHVNNTVQISRLRNGNQQNGAIYFLAVQGNTHWTNCVWSINSTEFNVYTTLDTHNDLTLDTCLIYNSTGLTGGWRFGPNAVTNLYSTAADMDAAQSGIALIDLATSPNPFPSGFDGPLHSSLAHAATNYPGVTNLAVDEDGRRLREPIALGAFAAFSYDALPATGGDTGGGSTGGETPVRAALRRVVGRAITRRRLGGIIRANVG